LRVYPSDAILNPSLSRHYLSFFSISLVLTPFSIDISRLISFITIEIAIAIMFENPLNAALLPPILYLLYRIVVPSWPEQKKPLPTTHAEGDYNWAPKAHPPVICSRKYNVHDLEPFHGHNEKEADGGKILLAIARINPDGSIKERTVFDVTKGRNFYGPGEGCAGCIALDCTDSRRHVRQLCRSRRVARHGQTEL
jgi:hypothetical protein